MNNEFLITAKRATNKWWDTHSTRTILGKKYRKTRGEFVQDSVREFLQMYKVGIDNNFSSGWMHQMRKRIGYEVGGNSGIDVGLRSRKSLYADKTTPDHIIGATLAGQTLVNAFMEYDCSIEYIVDFWLKDNLWLFCNAKLATEEHNILKKNQHTITQKINFEHYDELGIEIIYEEYNYTDSKKIIQPSDRAELMMNAWFDFKNTK